MPHRPTRSRIPSPRPLAVALAAAALVAAGCSAPPAATFNPAGLPGDPVRVMTYAPLTTKGGPTYPNIAATAKLYEQWVNDNGGVKGRPLQVDVCDEKYDPAAGASCARKAVQDNDVAVVGSVGVTGDVTVPILKAGRIAFFGGCCPLSAAELASDNAFPLGNGPMYGAALAARAVADGHTKIGLVLVQGAESYQKPIDNTLAALGQKLVRTVSLPASSQDFSPQVAEATDGTDALLMVASEGLLKAWMPAFAQSGSTAQLYGPQGNLDPFVAEGFEDQLNGAVIAGSYPDLSLPMWNDFRGAIDRYKAPTDLDYNSLGGLGTWAAFSAFRQVADGTTGDLTGPGFLAAAAKARAVDTGGMTPTLDFTMPWSNGLPGYARLFNRTAVYSTLKDGKVEPLTSTFQDFTDLALGKPKS